LQPIATEALKEEPMNDRNRRVIGVLIGCMIVVAVWFAMTSDDQEENERLISWNELPQVVQETIREQAGDHQITEIEEETVDGQVFYEAEWMEDGMEVEILVAADGTLIEREVEEPDDDEDDDD
jgi:hypothetical protein